MEKSGKRPGHDPGTDMGGQKAPKGYTSPAVHAPLKRNPVSVNQKTGDSGAKGGENR